MLNPSVGIFGIKAMRKLARELPRWPQEMEKKQLEASLRHMAEYTGVPPIVPERLSGFPGTPDHSAGRAGFGQLLAALAVDYNCPLWADAASLFEQAAGIWTDLTEVIVNFILGEENSLEAASTLILRGADLEKQAYHLLLTTELELENA
jgi:hypothetical protein